MRQRGVTLIELLVSSVMIAIVAVGALGALNGIFSFQRNVIPQRERMAEDRMLEHRLRTILAQAYLAPDAGDTTTYFLLGTAAGPNASTDANGLPDTLTFTTLGRAPAGAAIESVDLFESQNEQFGPQGGPAEVTLSMSAYGDAGERSGLFMRRQQPSDGDPTQGGFESLFSGRIASLGFEAFDGTQWVTEWDSITLQQGRLPSAVRLTYALVGEEDRPRLLVVRLPLSDVTPEDPAGIGEAAP